MPTQKSMNEPAPLADEVFFETCGIRVLTALRRIIRAVDLHSRKLNGDYQITAPQMICLYSLARHGEMTQIALAKQVSLSASTVNGIIDRLEKRAYVQRRRCDQDRRRVYVSISESGRELTQSAPALLQDKLAAALRRLPELEQFAIATSLERVVELMSASELDASPNLLPNAAIEEAGAANQKEL